MPALTPSPDLGQLRRQAKELVRAARGGDAAALARLGETLAPPRLCDAQRALAREAGLRSWPELVRYVEARRADLTARRRLWLSWALEPDARGHRLAVRMLADDPDLVAADPWIACAAGDADAVSQILARQPEFASRRGNHQLTPLAVTVRSRLIHAGRKDGLIETARRLLAAGADPNARWIDPDWPENPLPVLYAAAGITHDPEMTALLLAAGAEPDDGESLYHATESRSTDCARALLDAGARIAGTNAVARALDFDNLAMLDLLLARGADATAPAGGPAAADQNLLRHALDRGRSLAHLRALIDAGANPRAVADDGASVADRARQLGRTDVLDHLGGLGIAPAATEGATGIVASFVAACTRGDAAAAGEIRQNAPDVVSRLSANEVRLLPELAGLGAGAAVRVMLAEGWPIEARAAEWDATALNTAMFKGDAEMVALLLDAGADWQARHGFGDNVLGTLAFASQSEGISDPAPRDWAGCAATLLAHGVPRRAFEGRRYAPEVEAVLDPA